MIGQEGEEGKEGKEGEGKGKKVEEKVDLSYLKHPLCGTIENDLQYHVCSNPIVILSIFGFGGLLLLIFAIDIFHKTKVAVMVMRYIGHGNHETDLESQEFEACNYFLEFWFYNKAGGEAIK